MSQDPGEPTERSADDVAEQYTVELAGLSDAEREQVVEALEVAQFEGTLEHTDINELILDAQIAEDHIDEAEEYQLQQAQAADEGDYEAQSEYAEKAGEALETAAAHGADLDQARLENDHDVMMADQAVFHHETAEMMEEDAAYYGEAGSDMAADSAAGAAIDHAQTADDYSDQADQGGGYADHTIETDD